MPAAHGSLLQYSLSKPRANGCTFQTLNELHVGCHCESARLEMPSLCTVDSHSYAVISTFVLEKDVHVNIAMALLYSQRQCVLH